MLLSVLLKPTVFFVLRFRNPFKHTLNSFLFHLKFDNLNQARLNWLRHSDSFNWTNKETENIFQPIELFFDFLSIFFYFFYEFG